MVQKLKKFFVPQKHFLGLADQKDRSLPYALITPYATDALAQKRRNTINNWLNTKADKIQSPSVIDNLPSSGFVLTQVIRRGEYGSADKWLVQDPRGFELEICSENVAEIFAYSMVDRGHILSPMIWARKGKVNWLVVDGSPPCIEAMNQEDNADLHQDWNSVKLGSVVRLTDGTVGQYMGKMWSIIESLPDIQKPNPDRFTVTPTPNYVIHVPSTSITWTSRYVQELECSPGIELDTVLQENDWSVEYAEQIVNQLLNDPSCYLRCARGRHAKLMTLAPIKKNSWVFELTHISTGYQNFLDVLQDHQDQTVIVQTQDNTWGSVIKKFNTDTFSFYPIDKELLDQGHYSYITKKTTKGNFVGSYVKKEIDQDIDQIKNLYSIHMCLTSNTGDSIRVKI